MSSITGLITSLKKFSDHSVGKGIEQEERGRLIELNRQAYKCSKTKTDRTYMSESWRGKSFEKENFVNFKMVIRTCVSMKNMCIDRKRTTWKI